ncbi:class I SAM-dependent DNA methyltransferase [Aphanizomenon flos-aquae]|jgi:hypothetical protein|uniref:site-specific DNA-methyltransferase (adenine-specific) n=1 Tax=Aphanizomenon flos-aquae FACHB-1040 TaxID=2692887 RepID=A0ABR8BUY8_APHFL|nr:class I SAM-dependent DNA methyltransferase [Aphanizomenon flos-aquae]MBD2277581.1 class I SAM-dependent DNA methyltransferase [Aphanizomenon flos-aquae FACHB-1040]
MTSSTPETLSKFVQFCHQHITGQERKEAQTFLDRFFRAFGHEGALEAGATYEEAIKKSSKTGKTGFADLVWKPRVLIEMKKRGEDLNKHYSQAFDYWTRLVPNRPKYVILCNFDEFWIFDFDIQLDTPVDKITLEQLPERSGALTFMELGQKTPVFQNNQVEVTVKAARRMGELLLELENRGIEKLTAQRFILQCVLAMFAEDRQLLPRDMFVSCVQDCMKGGSSYDVLGGLFRGFLISEEEAREWIKIDSKNADVLKPMIDGKTLINPCLTLDWVIDFNDMSIEKASEYELPLKRVKEKVKPQKDINRSNLSQTYWWRFRRYSPAMRTALKGLKFYFALPKIAKWVIFTPVDVSILPCEANMVIASDDFYILGILTSNLHRMWVKAQSSTLEDRTRYTNTTCFETFPFPQTVDIKIVEKIRTKAKELHQYRTQQMETKQWGITTLYNKFFNEPSSQLYKLHQQLDKLVMSAYNFQANDDILEKLLILNLELAEKEKQGIKIIGPGSPN